MRVLQHECTTAATSGDNTILARPGQGLRYFLRGYKVQNESATATTWILYDGPSADGFDIDRLLGQNQGDGSSVIFQSDEGIYLREDTALVLNLSGANSHGVVIWYRTVDA